MAVIKGSLREDGADLTYKCFICDEKATAFWSGTKVMEVCAQCATDTLPKLIVDATHQWRTLGNVPDTIERLDSLLEKVTSAFWRAAFHWANVKARPYRKIPDEVVKQYSDEDD